MNRDEAIDLISNIENLITTLHGDVREIEELIIKDDEELEELELQQYIHHLTNDIYSGF